jgi:UDPglucose 6-dehydrogenase
MTNVAVVGCGHVGAVTAAGLARLGHVVCGVDTSEDVVALLNSGNAAFSEPDFKPLLREGLSSGRLNFTASYEEGLSRAEIIFLCVNTPATFTGAADLRFVRAAATEIAGTLRNRTDPQALIVNKSTAPIGTGETIEMILARYLGTPLDTAICANPEFLREGSAVHDFFNPERIVIGAARCEDARRVAGLYEALGAPILTTDLRSAEMIKYVSNAFLATRVSFVNEIARLCESLDVEVDGVLEGVGLDSRIGKAYFRPGIGYGGSCLPKDVAALCHTGEIAGLTMRVLQAVQEANVSQRTHALNCIRRLLGTLDGKTIAVWGITFKGSTEDLRESPALDIVALLRNEGASLRIYDPALAGTTPEFYDDPLIVTENADALAVLSDWPQFATADFAAVRDRMAGRVVYDGRNHLARAQVEIAGLVYYGVGRSSGRDTPLASGGTR